MAALSTRPRLDHPDEPPYRFLVRMQAGAYPARIQIASLAQLVEQLTLNQRVEGSSPSGGTFSLRVRSSIPRTQTTATSPSSSHASIAVHNSFVLAS